MWIYIFSCDRVDIISCESIEESEEMLSPDIGSSHMANMEPEMNLAITVNTFQPLF